MDYREKYEQALENLKRIKKANRDNKELVDFIEYQYPELKESEGEKVRKWLIEMVEALRKANPTNASHNGNCSEAIFWLEKQGEQTPVKWSEEDELNFNQAIYVCHQYGYFGVELWLKSLKQRMKGETK